MEAAITNGANALVLDPVGSACDARIPSITASSTRLAVLGEAPGDQHALLGPVRPDGEKDRVHKQAARWMIAATP